MGQQGFAKCLEVSTSLPSVMSQVAFFTVSAVRSLEVTFVSLCYFRNAPSCWWLPPVVCPLVLTVQLFLWSNPCVLSAQVELWCVPSYLLYSRFYGVTHVFCLLRWNCGITHVFCLLRWNSLYGITRRVLSAQVELSLWNNPLCSVCSGGTLFME